MELQRVTIRAVLPDPVLERLVNTNVHGLNKTSASTRNMLDLNTKLMNFVDNRRHQV
jgi:hypothetical protein